MNSQDAQRSSIETDEFRRACSVWLENNCPPGMKLGAGLTENRCWGGKKWTFESDDQEAWLSICAERGWTVPHWPEEFGGAGLTILERDIIREEMKALGIREPLYSYGITMLGPALLKYGTEQQKAMHLPSIARGEIRWCQGYSEPRAGSDLASLKTRCEDKGDHWLINGQKIWTSKADQSDWMFALVRTSDEVRKHDGISFLLIDLDLPGITVRPIELISGESPFCEVFFDDVKVLKEYGSGSASMVGENGNGWEGGMYLLGHERSSLGGYTLDGRGDEQPLLERAIEVVGLDASNQLDDPSLRMRLSAAIIDDAACSALAEELNERIQKGENVGAESSLVKYASTQIIKLGYDLRMAVEGFDVFAQDRSAGKTHIVTQNWLYSRAYTILGGTSEIQLNIIAKRLLDLPKR